MNMKTWTAVLIALLFHVALFAAAEYFPQQQQIFPPDFEAPDNLVSSGLLSEPKGPRICSVHGVEMTITEVRIIYGLLWEYSNPDAYRRANPAAPPRAVREVEFPNAQRWVWGGCCMMDDRSTRTYICPECERAEEQWKDAHQPPP